MKHPLHQRQNGQILISLIIVVPSLMLIVAAYLTLSTSSFHVSQDNQFHTDAQLAADAGADYALEQMAQNTSYTGTGSEVVLHNDGLTKTTYSVVVVNNSSTSKTIQATGRTYWPASAASPSSHVTIDVDLRPVTQGTYSIVSGEGGLVMSNSSKIVAGNILINGTISLSNTAQIGLTTNPVTVTVADQACPVPPDSTYPRLCNTGEGAQPISISNSAHIYGTVSANNQISGLKMSNPGLVASSGVTPQPLPTYDRNAQKAAVATTISGASASCSSGSQTWSANTKITGNVSISNKCKVTVNGNVWITGNLSLSNTAQMIVADSLGSTIPNIMVDGSAGASFANSAQLVANASSTGFEIYSFWSSAGCSPDCSSVTGTDLSNSRNITTISLTQSASAAQTIFYAYWSAVQIANAGAIGALIGQTVRLSNSGTITFGTSVVTGGATTWVSNGYRRSYN
jgi:hypothetical protein